MGRVSQNLNAQLLETGGKKKKLQEVLAEIAMGHI
jgi:hypothetical protein